MPIKLPAKKPCSPTPRAPPTKSSRRSNLQEWINAVARDEHTGSTAWDGYAATAVVDAAVKSLEDASSPLIAVELIDKPALYA